METRVLQRKHRVNWRETVESQNDQEGRERQLSERDAWERLRERTGNKSYRVQVLGKRPELRRINAQGAVGAKSVSRR